MLKIILITIAVIIVAFVVVVWLQPSTFRVERSASIAASGGSVFAQVNDFHNWDAWSPWAKLDPACKNTFEGPAAGVGAVFAWSGNNKVGAGRMAITESHPGELIRIRLEFLKPFKATHTAEFAFKANGDQTVVTWAMFGGNSFLSKAMGLFMNCDKMIGGDFEKGLAGMKAVTEAAAGK